MGTKERKRLPKFRSLIEEALSDKAKTYESIAKHIEGQYADLITQTFRARLKQWIDDLVAEGTVSKSRNSFRLQKIDTSSKPIKRKLATQNDSEEKITKKYKRKKKMTRLQKELQRREMVEDLQDEMYEETPSDSEYKQQVSQRIKRKLVFE